MIAPSLATNGTAAIAAVSGRGRLTGLLIAPTGAVTPTVTVYDALTATGTILAQVKTLSATPIMITFPDGGVQFTTGCYVDASAWTTLSATVYTTGY